ncbi:MAG: nitroreductase family protein [Actinomycetota bacterium]|nr:nitroreductase family protein [Actinomycetota bacterium]MDI6822401.1 nitroreductase family protein [Actinomycetota bacterium]
MEVYEAIYGRKSVRDFDRVKDVPPDLVMKLLKAACQAPSAGNLQPWRFWVIRDQKLKGRLAEAAFHQSFVAEAPILIVVCADLRVASSGYGTRGTALYAIQDTAAAIENLLLAAHVEGLGACWVGAFDERRAIQAMELPAHIRPLALIPIGYPAYVGTKPQKRDPLEVTEFK